MKKILFGAGLYGKIALDEYGEENVECFADNDVRLVGNKVHGKDVIDLRQLEEISQNYEVVITVKKTIEIEEQLKACGIEYKLYSRDSRRYYPTEELVVNPYLNEDDSFMDVSCEGVQSRIVTIDKEVERLYHDQPLFDHIEIETVNRCNGNCSFCPVSIKNDTREYVKMSLDLFKSIIDQLAELEYSGKIALFSNNEPFLDDDIVEKHKYARAKLPKARFHLFTNGTLLTLDLFVEIMKYLDELVIDNYNQKLELIKPCKDIKEYCEAHPEYKSRVTIVLRKQQEVLTNRGGDAPNRQDEVSYPHAKCVLPYRQMIIRPDGKVSLCCNDPLGKNTLADLKKERVIDAWNNPRFQMVRKCLYENGRKDWKHCEHCDVFNLG